MAKKGQSQTIGEFIKPSVMEVAETVMKEDSSSMLSCLPLINGTVQRHIDEMALDVEVTLISETRVCNSSG